MLPLLVRITNTQTGEVEHAAFASSPVRIGRNQLNELVLNEPFVSQWHAVVRFDEHKIRYVDLGSTNGTMMNGRRLARHVQVEVDPQVDLRIGPVQLAFARAAVTPDMYAAPKTTMFTIAPSQSTADVSSATMAFGAAEPRTLEQHTMFLGGQPQAVPGKPQGPPTGAGLPGGVDMQQLVQLVDQTRPYYDQYRRTWSALLQGVRAQLERVPGPQREGMVLCLLQQFPQLSREPEFKTMMEALGVNPTNVGEVDPTEWLKRLGGHSHLPPGAQVNTALAMERVGAILESFGQAFVELRKGYEQFGEEMALQLVQERNPLHDADSGQDVLRYLLDWSHDGGERVRELTRAFADLALHQVALLNGVMEGIRGMLQQISPMTLSGATNLAIAREAGGGFLEKIFNARKASLWRRFAERHQNLVDEDRFSREVFGRNFARAYFMVTGGHMEEPSLAQPGSPQYGRPQTKPF